MSNKKKSSKEIAPLEIHMTEEQAEWIRIGLQCYLNTCQVPASFGSQEFLKKVNQIANAISWFDVTIQEARVKNV